MSEYTYLIPDVEGTKCELLHRIKWNQCNIHPNGCIHVDSCLDASVSAAMGGKALQSYMNGILKDIRDTDEAEICGVHLQFAF